MHTIAVRSVLLAHLFAFMAICGSPSGASADTVPALTWSVSTTHNPMDNADVTSATGYADLPSGLHVQVTATSNKISMISFAVVMSESGTEIDPETEYSEWVTHNVIKTRIKIDDNEPRLSFTGTNYILIDFVDFDRLRRYLGDGFLGRAAFIIEDHGAGGTLTALHDSKHILVELPYGRRDQLFDLNTDDPAIHKFIESSMRSMGIKLVYLEPEQRPAIKVPDNNDANGTPEEWEVARQASAVYHMRYEHTETSQVIHAIDVCYADAKKKRTVTALQFCFSIDRLAEVDSVFVAMRGGKQPVYLNGTSSGNRMDREFAAFGLDQATEKRKDALWFAILTKL